MLMGRSFRYSFPLRVMLMTGSSSLVSLTCLTSGTLISRPNSITCAVSMKMISTTSTTSTSGTILISESAPLPAPKRRRPRPLLVPLVPLTEKAMLIRLALEHALDRVLQFEREALQLKAGTEAIPGLLERRDTAVAAAEFEGDGGGGKLGLRSAIREL